LTWNGSRPTNIDVSSDAIQLTKEALELYYSFDPPGITFSRNVTWDDVSQTARKAREDQDNQKTLSPNNVVHRLDRAKADYLSKGRLHNFGRSLGDIAPSIVHKLDYAPDEMYIGIVCQGLKFIFDVSSDASPFLAVEAKDAFRSRSNLRKNGKRFSTRLKTYPR